MSDYDPALQAARRSPVAGLRRRVYLTYKHHGLSGVAERAVAFPLRLTPFALRLRLGRSTIERRMTAKKWFEAHGRPVTVVIPSFGGAASVQRTVESLRKTTSASYVRVVVCDDAGPRGELAKLRLIRGIELIEGERNLGFAGNANRGLAQADPDSDVVLLNSDVKAEAGWLESLEYAAYAESPDVGIAGARLLYPNRSIQHAGLHRNPHAPEWFDHYYRFAPLNYGLADVPHPVLAVTGACMYVKRSTIDRIGLLDPDFPMGFEDVDWSLRTWSAGLQVVYEPAAILEHTESASRGRRQGERELQSQRHFWTRWGSFFDKRNVAVDGNALRVIYVTEGTGIGGGHRLVFEDINRMFRRGHDITLFTLEPAPDWFALDAPIRTFSNYDELVRTLAPLDAIKIATWWRTAPHVWRASVVHGIPVYFVQDIETSYYPDSEHRQHEVLATYRNEFRYLTTSAWNRDRLAELHQDAVVVPPGVDLETFRPLERPRRSDMILAIGRANALKRFDLTASAWRLLEEPRPQLCVFGVEPEIAPPGSVHINGPSDDEVNELLNACAVFVQTSSHEGFALPPLEAMAAGAAVVCTDADGNRDYCVDGVNCLIPAPEPRAIAAALRRVLADQELQASLAAAGIATARRYRLEQRTRQLEEFLIDVATGARQRGAPHG